METEFTQEIEDGTDPFGGSDFGDFEPGPKAEPDAPADATGLPVVNREGERVEPTAEGGVAPGTPEAAPAPLQTPPPGPTDPAAEGAAYDAQHAAPEQPQEPESAAPADEYKGYPIVEASAEGEPESEPDPQPASSPEPQASAEPEDAPVPEERQSEAGKSTYRRYLVLRVTSPGQFEQVSWYEDAKGKMAPKGTPGSKRQTIALARTSDDALKVGFLACGAPQDGVTLIAVAAAYFQAKPVKPKAPEPTRQRLQIG